MSEAKRPPGGFVPIREFLDFWGVSRAFALRRIADAGAKPVRVGRRVFVGITAAFREALEARKATDRRQREEAEAARQRIEADVLAAMQEIAQPTAPPSARPAGRRSAAAAARTSADGSMPLQEGPNARR